MRPELFSRPRLSDALVRQYVFGQALGGFMLSVDKPAFRFQDLGATPGVGTSSEPLGLVLDQRMGGARGDELRGGFAVASVGTTPTATYNAATGSGTLYRTDVSNQSGLTLTGLTASKTYGVSLNCTGTGVNARSGGITAASWKAITSPGLLAFVITGFTSFSLTAALTGSADFTDLTVREIPGTHFGQSTSTSRPLILADAQGLPYAQVRTDDWLASLASVDYSAAAYVTTVVAARRRGNASSAIFEHGTAGASGTIAGFQNAGGLAGSIGFRLRGSSDNTFGTDATAAPLGDPYLFTGYGSIAAKVSVLKVNAQTVLGGDPGTGTFANGLMYLFARGGASLFADLDFYAMLQIATAQPLTPQQLQLAQLWAGSKMGVRP